MELLICLQNVSFSFSTLLEFWRQNLGVPKSAYWPQIRSRSTPVVKHAIFFYNSIVTKFCELDISLCFNVLDYNVGRTPSVFKKVFWTIVANNKVKIVANIPWFIIKNHTFANEQKRHVGKLRSWVIIIVPHVKWTLLYFHSCHSSGALKSTLSVLFFLNFLLPWVQRWYSFTLTVS